MSPASEPSALQVGRRVVVRYRRPEGSHPPLSDVVGVVLEADEAQVVVAGTRGRVAVRRQDVVVVRAVPPAPVRRGRPHTAISTDDLELVMVDGWRAVEEGALGDWVLRASSGFTKRANSVLAVGDSGLAPDRAVDRVEDWYASRGLPATVALPLPVTGDAADDELGSLLLGRGYLAVSPTLVMTGASSDVEPLRDSAAPVSVSVTLTPEWLDAYARQREIRPGVTEEILTGSAGQFFLSTSTRGGHITAVARVSITPGWAGLQGLWVEPEQRGRGLGRTVLHAAGLLARQRRTASIYLQVEQDSEAAIGLYESEGFRPHHAYAYLVRDGRDHPVGNG